MRPATTLASGHRFRVVLHRSSVKSLGTGRNYSELGDAPATFYFATRPVLGNPIGSSPDDTPFLGDTNSARDLLSVGNLLFVASNTGALVTIDLADETTPLDQPRQHRVHSIGNRPADQVRTLATDGHNRVFFSAQMGSTWTLGAVRVEDARQASSSCDHAPAWAAGMSCFDVALGGVRVAAATDPVFTPLAGEWTAASALPMGMPSDLEIVTQDEEGLPLPLEEFFDVYNSQAGEADAPPLSDFDPDGDGLFSFPISLTSSYRRAVDGRVEPSRVDEPGATPLDPNALLKPDPCAGEAAHDRFQRVTVDNITTGQSWSFDVENTWPGSDGDGTITGIQISARRGDRLRVRYNLTALGYVAVVGSGLHVVDLNRFYGRAADPPAPGGTQCGRLVSVFQGRDVDFSECNPAGSGPQGLAFTTAVAVHGQTECAGDRICGEKSITSYSPLVHVGGITTTAKTSKPSEIGLQQPIACISEIFTRPVQLRDVALANEVDLVDYGIRGSLAGVFNVPDRPTVRRVRGDLLFLSLGEMGVYAFDVSERTLGSLIGHLRVPGHSVYRLQVDTIRELLFAGGFDSNSTPIIDVWDLRSVNGAPQGPASTRPAPQPLLTLTNVPWLTNNLGLDTTGTGLLYAWSGDEGALAVPFDLPKLTFAGLFPSENSDLSESARVDRLTPLGVPMEIEVADETAHRDEDDRKGSAVFKLRASLPGFLGEEIVARVQSLRALPPTQLRGAPDVGAAEAPPGGPGWPDPEVEVTLRRIGTTDSGANGRFATTYNLYESVETIVLVADPRAGRGYQRQDLPDAGDPGDVRRVGDEAAQCRRCKWPSFLPDPTGDDPALDSIVELLAAGPYLRAYLSPSSNAADFFASQGASYPAPTGIVRVSAWADSVPSPMQVSLAEPARGAASFSTGEAGLVVSMADGDSLLSTVDQTVQGRGLAFTLDRSYRSGGLGFGALGSAPWSSSLLAHLREIPTTGEVEYYDGSGSVWRFIPRSEPAPATHEPDSIPREGSYHVPRGLALRLAKLAAQSGWQLLGENGDAAIFDNAGRLVELRDRLRRNASDPQTQGNTIRLVYDAFGQLTYVVDDLGRSYRFEYDTDPASSGYGLLLRVVDFSGRNVEYSYDGARRLTDVVLPGVTNEVIEGFDHPSPTVSYEYVDTIFGAKAPAHGAAFSGLRLKGIRPVHDAGENAPLAVEIQYDGTGRVQDLVYPDTLPYGVAWTPMAGDEAPFPVTRVEITAPWSHKTRHDLALGRISRTTELGVPVLRNDDPTPPPAAPPSLASIDLITSYEYEADGRVRKVTRPDGSFVTISYRSGDHLVRSGIETITQHQGAAPAGSASYTTTEQTYLYGEDNGGADNLPAGVRDALARTHFQTPVRLLDTGAPETEPGFEGVVDSNNHVATASKRTFDVFGRTTEVQAGMGEAPSGAVADSLKVSQEFNYAKANASSPEGSGLLRRLTVGVGSGEFSVDLTRDEIGRVVARTASFGIKDTTAYDEWDRAIELVEGKQQGQNSQFAIVDARSQLAFDSRGRLALARRSQSDLPGGWAETTYVYDQRDRPIQVTQNQLAPSSPGESLVSGMATYSFGTNGLLLSSTSAAGITTVYGYDASGRQTSTSVPGVDGVKRVAYDDMGRPVWATDGHEAVWRGRYDAWGRLYQEELPTGTRVAREFDRAGQLLKEVVAGPAPEDPEDPWPQLSVTEYSYHPSGAVETIRQTLDDNRALVTTRSYDTAGRLLSERSSDGVGQGRLVASYNYADAEASGRLSSITTADGTNTTYFYDTNAPWPARVRIEETSPAGADPVPPVVHRLTRDALGRVIGDHVDGGGPGVTLTLDEAGNVLEHSSGGSLPNPARATYDARGSVIRVDRANTTGFAQEMGYDLDGRVLLTRVLRESGTHEEASYTYDNAGRLSSRTRPGSPTEHFRYNPDDTLAETDTRLANGDSSAVLTLAMSYDAANRLTAIAPLNAQDFSGTKLPAGLAELDAGDAFTWDALSRPTGAARKLPGNTVDTLGQVTTAYQPGDPRPYPSSETVGALAAILGGGASWARGVYGNPGTLTLPGGLLPTTLTFDDVDRLVTASAGLPFESSFTWSGGSRLRSVSSHGAAGVSHAFTYGNAAALPSRLAVEIGGHSLGAFDFDWNAPSMLKQGRSTLGSPASDPALGSLGWTWQHDAGHRLAGAKGDLDQWSYIYGRADELLSALDRDGQSLFVSGFDGRPVSLTDPDGGSETFTYDDEGRRLADGRYSFTWDWRGRLVRSDVADSSPTNPGERVDYAYDATGRLLTRTHWGTIPLGGGDADRPFLAKRLFVWDGARLAAEVGLNYADLPIWRRQYLPGPNELDDAPQVLVENGLQTGAPTSTLYAFMRDELGSVIGLVEEAAVSAGDPMPLLARFLYTPYGEAHVEYGPEVRRIWYDPAITVLNLVDQAEPVPGETMPGGLRVRTSIALDPSSLFDAVRLERLDGLEWVPLDSAEYEVSQDSSRPEDVLVMPVAGFSAGDHLRVVLAPELADHAGRTLVLPAGMLGQVEVELGIPADLAAPTGLPREFPLVFDNIAAASATLNERFPGGQTMLFQGLWADPVTGMAYARNRWYDERNAAWLSEDPAGPADSPNLYAAFGLEPHMATDPMGRESGATFAALWQKETLNGRTVAEAIGPPATRAEAAFRGFVGGGLLLLGVFASGGALSAVLPPVAIATLGWGGLAAGGTAAYGQAYERYCDQYYAGRNPSLLVSGGLGLADTFGGLSHIGEGVMGRDWGTGLLLSEQQAIARLQGGVTNATIVFGGLGMAGAGRLGSAEVFPSSAPGRGASARISETGRGVYGHQVVDRIAAEAQGAFSQANRMLMAGNRSTPWARLYQRVQGSGRWFENVARRNALHQLAERQLLNNRYVLEARRAGYIVQFNKGSALGLRGARGGLLRPDIQIGIPGGRWGIVDWTTEGSAAKIFNYSDPQAPFLINVTLP